MSRKQAILLLFVLYPIAVALLEWASWKIMLGVVIFGWAMNIERKYL
jgi:hypothetical protein